MKSKLLKLVVLFLLAGFIACDNEKKDSDDKVAGDQKDDTVAQNIEKTKSFYPLFEKGDWAGIEAIVAPEFKDHSPMIPEGTASNRDSLMKYLKMTKEGYPDLKFEVMHVAGVDDMVFVHYRFTGTNTGPFMGMPATNKKIDYTGVDLLKIKDGKAVEHWDYADNVTYMKQMGMMPEGQ